MLEILRYPHRSLRAPTKMVSPSDVERVTAITAEMIAGLKELMAVGLAANQVGDSLSYCVVAPPNETPFALINPVITAFDDRTTLRNEGCLSLPGITVPVERPSWVTVESLGGDGRLKVERFDGETARTVCHELDHLDGRLILDCLPPVKRTQLKARIAQCVRVQAKNEAYAARMAR